jgi:hypothetical protein
MHGTEAALYVAIDSQPAANGAAGEDQQDWEGGSVRRNR